MEPKEKHCGPPGGFSRQEGSIGDLLSVGICILAMLVIMLSFMDCVRAVNRKTAVGQLARKYILSMETSGYLTASMELELLRELAENGVTEADLSGTTRQEVSYGSHICLKIRGKIGGKHDFEEVRVSTAKN